MNKHTHILEASTYQGDPQFGQYGGTQCTAIAAYAIAYSNAKITVEFWDTKILDSILQEGNDYYISWFLKVDDKQEKFLSAYKVLGIIKMRLYNVKIDYFYSENNLTKSIVDDKAQNIEANNQLDIHIN